MKQKRLKNLMYACAFLSAFIFTNDLFSQSSNDDWNLAKDSIHVKFYYKTVLCNNIETILYKITSSNQTAVTLNWTVWGVGSEENISISPNEEKTGSCTLNNKLAFAIPPGAAIVNNVLPIEFTVFN